MLSVVSLGAQRIRIGKQLQKALGPNYIVLTDSNGEQYYTPFVDATATLGQFEPCDQLQFCEYQLDFDPTFNRQFTCEGVIQ